MKADHESSGMSDAERLVIKLQRPGGTAQPIRLSALLVFLERLSGALGSLDRTLNGRHSTYFDVADLRYGSAIVELSERLDERRRAQRHKVRPVFSSFHELLLSTKAERRPTWATSAVLSKLRTLAEPLPYEAVAIISTPSAKSDPFMMDADFRESVERLLSPDSESEGQITGRLDAINMHGRRHAYLYPLLGHQKVVCDFSLLSDSLVVGALQHRVQVLGRLRRRSGDPHPYHVTARELVVLPEDHELPTLQSLRGCFVPTYTGTTEEFLKAIRGE